MARTSCPIQSKLNGTECGGTSGEQYEQQPRRGPPRFVVLGLGIALGMVASRKFEFGSEDE
ncbi:hypothetical protein [Haladaptatus sp. DYF46]|uniref:hypothetical protein n=1 Tax=Haladaptatus sp. DYF46 TaxID=2886041 RepID=UPI001E5B6578|nr:hypothetical protein [Haladaptatus sp. DYF46]